MFIKKGTEYVSWQNDFVRVVAIITDKETKAKTVVVANLKAPGGKSTIPYDTFCGTYTERLPLAAAQPEERKPTTDPRHDRNGWAKGATQ